MEYNVKNTVEQRVEQFAVGDSIKEVTICELLPVGTIVGYAHPVYQSPFSAVRCENALGERWWASTSSAFKQTSQEIKRTTGWAPFVILFLPGKSEPLNTEVRTGYRTYGQPKKD